MFGKNPKLSIENKLGEYLHVHSIFLTYQGEGPYIGRAAIFIRLSGCNLACNFCDTDFDSFTRLSYKEIFQKAKVLSDDINFVVITGGEPFRQNISLLCEIFLANKFHVQVETNGTIYQPIPKEVAIVCSPKNNNGQYNKIRSEILNQTIALKFLVSQNRKGYQNIPELGQKKNNIPIYVQPIDDQDIKLNNQNLELAKKIAAENNCFLSIQLHKYLGIQ